MYRYLYTVPSCVEQYYLVPVLVWYSYIPGKVRWTGGGVVARRVASLLSRARLVRWSGGGVPACSSSNIESALTALVVSRR